jgi:hypothetical protein
MKSITTLIIAIISMFTCSIFISCGENQTAEKQSGSSSTAAEKPTTEQNGTSAANSLSQASADVNFHPEYPVYHVLSVKLSIRYTNTL